MTDTGPGFDPAEVGGTGLQHMTDGWKRWPARSGSPPSPRLEPRSSATSRSRRRPPKPTSRHPPHRLEDDSTTSPGSLPPRWRRGGFPPLQRVVGPQRWCEQDRRGFGRYVAFLPPTGTDDRAPAASVGREATHATDPDPGAASIRHGTAAARPRHAPSQMLLVGATAHQPMLVRSPPSDRHPRPTGPPGGPPARGRGGPRRASPTASRSGPSSATFQPALPPGRGGHRSRAACTWR